MLNSLVDLVRIGDFVVLDTETTGLRSPAEIIQLAVIDSRGKTLIDTYLCPARKAIPIEATLIHGITSDMVADSPFWPDIKPALLEIIHDKTVVVYNAKYDRQMLHLSDEAWRLPYTDYHESSLWWCAMEAYAEYRGEWNNYHDNYRWHKLADAAQHMGVPSAGAHDALSDCIMTLAVVNALSEILDQ